VTVANGTLVISAVAVRHRGNYTCLAADQRNHSDHCNHGDGRNHSDRNHGDHGNHSDRRSVYVHVKSPGTSLVPLHVTSSAVTLTWRGLHSSREYRVRYGEKSRDFNNATSRLTGEVLVKPYMRSFAGAVCQTPPPCTLAPPGEYMRSFTASHLAPRTTYTFCIDVRQATFNSRCHATHDLVICAGTGCYRFS